MKIKTFQFIKIVLSLIILGVFYYLVSPHITEYKLFFDSVAVITVIFLIIGGVKEYTDLFTS